MKHRNVHLDRKDKQYGIHLTIKDEDQRINNARLTTPMDVCVTLASNQVHNGLYEAIPMPSVRQVSNEIAKVMCDGENLYEKAMNKIDAFKYDPLKK